MSECAVLCGFYMRSLWHGVHAYVLCAVREKPINEFSYSHMRKCAAHVPGALYACSAVQ